MMGEAEQWVYLYFKHREKINGYQRIVDILRLFVEDWKEKESVLQNNDAHIVAVGVSFRQAGVLFQRGGSV